jgi:hypothetical protein
VFVPTDAGGGRCRWESRGSQGCFGVSSCTVWLRSPSPLLLTHMLGHALGLQHSSVDANNDGVVDPSRGDRESGDLSCPMGSTKRGDATDPPRFNAVQRWRLGWINDSATATVGDAVTAANPATVTLWSASDVAVSGPVLAIASTSTSTRFFLSHRRQVPDPSPAAATLEESSSSVDDGGVDNGRHEHSFDAFLDPAWSDTVFVHRSSGTQSLLVSQLRPGTDDAFLDTASRLHFTAALPATSSAGGPTDVPADSYRDVPAPVAVVRVTRCEPATPTLTLSSSSVELTGTCLVGGAADVTVSVTNPSQECSAARVVTTAIGLPPGWTLSPAAPRQCSTITVVIVSCHASCDLV